jgi:alpha/beta superfamily hydrolase
MPAEVLIPGLDSGSPGGLREPALEGLLELPEGPPWGSVVVAHPHPLYGGTMVQPVVYHAARECRREGMVSLRFNFRGVGGSEGRHEGWQERHDVRAACAFLRQRQPDLPLVLAGYSFGSLMAALAVVDGERPAALALIAFVVEWDEFMPGFFGALAEYGGPVLAVCGEKDELAPPEKVEAFLTGAGLRAELRLVEGADHYFVGSQNEVGRVLADFARRAIGMPPAGDEPRS